jgi:hypothetical protein
LATGNDDSERLVSALVLEVVLETLAEHPGIVTNYVVFTGIVVFWSA